MSDRLIKLYKKLSRKGLSEHQQDLIDREMQMPQRARADISEGNPELHGIYTVSDLTMLQGIVPQSHPCISSLQTLDDLLERDKKREEDGFPRRIRIGKFIKPIKGKKEKIVVVPSTSEPKFYHDDSVTTEEETTGGSGKGEEGDVIAEQQADPQEGDDGGQGAGQGKGEGHDISSDAFDLGKVLTEQFELPNLKVKGKKRSLTKYEYDLTDINRGFGQVLDKKATIRKIIETNILLGKIKGPGQLDPMDLMINPQDKIYRILSKEKAFEAQAVVFFIRDYSGSMQGKPTEVVVTQHLLIYSWLMYQYQGQVQVRFIVHDTDAKEVPDFYTYYRSAVSGGTAVYPSYELVKSIIDKEQLAKEYNIYIFQGTDGDDWEEDGQKAVDIIRSLLPLINRMGITVARNSWSSTDSPSVVEKYIESSGLLTEKPELLKMDSMLAEEADEARIIEGIRKLIT